MASDLIDALRAHPPLVHGGGDRCVSLSWPALSWLERQVTPGMSSLETGCGLSTVVFASKGASHVTITPMADEWERVGRFCAEQGISLEGVRFIAESSHTALNGTWTPEPLDLVLIDGAHNYPFPTLDWFYTAPHLKVGGRLIVDDAFLPSVHVLVRFLRSSSAWRFDGPLADRTVCFTKARNEDLGFEWTGTRFDRRPRFDYLPPARRALAWTRHVLLERTPLERVVREAIRRRGRST